MSFETGFIGFIQLFEMNEGETPPPGGDEIPDGELPEGAGELLLSPGALLLVGPEIEIDGAEIAKVSLSDPGLVVSHLITASIDAPLTTLNPRVGQIIVHGTADVLDALIQPNPGSIIYQAPEIQLIGGFMSTAGDIVYQDPGIVVDADLTILRPSVQPYLVLSRPVYVRVKDGVIVEVIKEESLSESMFVWDSDVTPHLGLVVSESTAIADSVEVKLNLLISEYISIRDTLNGQWIGNVSVSETVYAVDTASWIRLLYETISEALAITDAVTPELCLLVSDYIRVREAVTGNAIFNNDISETITAIDTSVVGLVLDILESLGIADALTLIKSVNESLEEALTFSEVLSGLGAFQVSVSEAARLTDDAKAGFSMYVSEALASVDTVSCFSEMYLTLSESLGATEAITAAIDVSVTLSENLYIIDSVSSQGEFYITVQEGVHLNVTIELDGEVYECWVLNTPGFYPSIYSGFDFNSYCVFDGRAFGANSAGIFELTGDTDAGSAIHTGMMTHETDFGVRNDKRFRKAYIGVSGDAPVMVMETGDGERITYAISSAGKVDASRSAHGRDWSLTVADFDELDTIQLVPVVLARGKNG